LHGDARPGRRVTLLPLRDVLPMVEAPASSAGRSSVVSAFRTLTGLTLLVAIAPAAATNVASASELRLTPLVRAVQEARSSIVNIHGEKIVGGEFGAPANEARRRVNGMGTGVVIDERGYIITNHHVVDGVRKILVTTADEQTHVAQLVSHDPKTDLA